MSLAYLYSATGNRLWAFESPNLVQEEVLLYADLAQRLCADHKADGLMLVNPETLELWSVNADGTAGKFCGNGVRAVAFHLQASRGMHHAELTMGGHLFAVEMQQDNVTMTLVNPEVKISHKEGGYFLEVPNPHLVFINPPATWTLAKEGAALCQKFNTNVELVYPEGDHVRVLVYERGVGPTQACGSGAIATFKVLQHLGLAQGSACIRMPGGDLTVQVQGDKLSVSGQVEFIETSPCI